MPIIKSAKKKVRVDKRRTVFNSLLKRQVSKSESLFKKDPSSKNLSKLFSAIDKAVKKNIFHKNKAARLKAGFSSFSLKTSAKTGKGANDSPKRRKARKAAKK